VFTVVRTDVSDPDQVAELIHRTVEHFGRLDFAFNNAGIEGAQAPTADCTLENWSRNSSGEVSLDSR
jgi:NAD(P)-dependent dehydrogenase (short-subunit alcohol dehydrogenase family)